MELEVSVEEDMLQLVTYVISAVESSGWGGG